MDCQVTSAHSPVLSCAADDARTFRARVANTTTDPRDEIEHHLAAMRAFALVLAGKRALADEIVALTVIGAWANIRGVDTGSTMRARLFRMLRNAYYAGRRKPEEGVANSFVEVTAQAEPDNSRADTGFRRVFDALPDEQREALILVGAEAFSLDDAATVCGCSPATIKSRLELGRRKLGVGASRREICAGTIVLRAHIEMGYRTALPESQDAQNRTGLEVGTRPARSLHPTSSYPAAAHLEWERLGPRPDAPGKRKKQSAQRKSAR